MVNRDEADKAKTHLKELLSGVPGVNGLAIIELDDGWAVRVNVWTVQGSPDIPTSIDGVPVQRHDFMGPLPRVHRTRTLDRPIHLVVHDDEPPEIRVVPFTEELA
jgi:hypothetical protein